MNDDLRRRAQRWANANYNGDGWENDHEHDLLVDLVRELGIEPVDPDRAVPDVGGRDLLRA